METKTWSLKSAVASDNYPYKNEDGTISKLNGVITSVILELVIDNGEDNISTIRQVDLDKPNIDNFILLDSISKETALQWALDAFNPILKKSIETHMSDRLNGTSITTRTIFDK